MTNNLLRVGTPVARKRDGRLGTVTRLYRLTSSLHHFQTPSVTITFEDGGYFDGSSSETRSFFKVVPSDRRPS